MTFAVLTPGGVVPVHAAGYELGPEWVRFYWLDENGYQYPATSLRTAEVRAINPVEA